jgi:hypothetical protein
MSTEKDDQWLDEIISQSIDTTKPQFDAEEWKKKHPDAFQSILSRRAKPAPSDQPDFLRKIFAHPIVGLAAAASVIVVVSGLLLTRDRQRPNGTGPEPQLVSQSPTKIVSMMSLRMAYQRGGLDALDRQFRDTLNTLGPGPSSLSTGQLLEGLNGF